MKILILDPVSEEAIKIIKENGVKVDLKYDFPKEKIGEIIDNYEGVVIRSRTNLKKDILENLKNLKFIIRAGVGLDNIDLETAKEKGISVFNTPEASSNSVAELTIGFLITISRFIPQANISLKKGNWERKKFKGNEIKGKKLGIIGLGRIGKKVAEKARALGMTILGYDPFVKEEKGIEMVDFDFLIKNSDFITLHAPLTEKTKHMINKETIEKMKDGVSIINCARGALIDEEALYQGLKSNKIRGAAVDVFEIEPPVNNKLLTLENFISTPHIGSITFEAQQQIGIEVVRKLIQYKDKKTI